MSVDVEDVATDVDLSQLIDFSVTFQPLQLTLQGILKRLGALEADNAQKADEIARLQSCVAELQEQRAVPRPSSSGRADRAEERSAADDPGEAAAGGDSEEEHAALWDEIEALKALLGGLRSDAERDRHTIDELYEARKRVNRRESRVPRVSVGGAGDASAWEPSRTPSRTPPGSADAARVSSAGGVEVEDGGDEGGEDVAMGDKILSKAHEPLALDATAAWRDAGADGDAATASASASGEVMQPPPRPMSGGVSAPHPPSAKSASRSWSAQMPRPASTSHHAVPSTAMEVPREDAGGASDVFVVAPMPGTSAGAAPHRGSVAAHARRVSSQTRQSVSVMDKLLRDSEDIAYLNRVVAEMLCEMKGLHEDVDRLHSAEARRDEAAGTADDDALAHRVQRLESLMRDTRRGSEHRDDGLRGELDEVRRQVRACSRLSEEDVDEVQGLGALAARVRELEQRAAALGSAQEVLDGKLDSVVAMGGAGGVGSGGEEASGVSGAQFAMLQGHVNALEKQLGAVQAAQSGGKDWSDDVAQLRRAVQHVQGEVEAAGVAVQRAARECERLDEVKADRGEGGGGAVDEEQLAELERRVRGVASAQDELDARVRELDDEKEDRGAVQRLREDLANLKRLMELNARRESARERGDGGGAAAVSEQLLRELQQQVVSQTEHSVSDREAARDELDALRELVEQLDHRKADATLVANKAERDYVENALERLMREVEQVLNATNAGLIDTLDKSLNLLRDMIDGRASKQDIARLQQVMAEQSGGASAADALTGFKGYRCLGCNRPVDSLRPRPAAPKMGTFVNRTPQNYPQDHVTRTIEQQQQFAATQLEAPLRGGRGSYRGGGLEPAPAGRSGSFHEPLPPIEGPSR